MLTNILKWAFKIGEKEAHLFLDSDMALDAVEEIAHQILIHTGKIKEQVRAQQAAKAAEEAKAEEPKQDEAVNQCQT